MTFVGVGAAFTLFWLVSEVPGWAIAAALGTSTDRFTRIWIGIVVTSIVGLVLAEAGRFSLGSVLGLVLAVVVAAVLLPRRRGAAVDSAAQRQAGLLAAFAALALVVWSWPPYQTVVGASDSTMYVNAGIHLARTGRLAVAESVTPMLPRDAARALFTSVGLFNAGPFIRLPGGLLMPTLESADATPAFFPLLPIWAGVMALAGGPGAAVLVAPIFMALAVWSFVLFTGEALGVVAAAVAALMLLANFAIWWFAKFPMPEPLAMAAIWGGLVLLRRATSERAPATAFLAGAVFGLAGLARTETLLFLAAAGAVAWAWGSPRAPLLSLLSGFALLASASVVYGELAPSHHLAYLRNDLGLQYVVLYRAITQSGLGPLLRIAGVVGLATMIAGGVVGARSNVGVTRGFLRVAAPLATAVALLVYVRVGGLVTPARDLSWLAAYCSWPALALTLLGSVVAWRRGGEVVQVAAYAWLLATVVFVLNPRIAPFQPWAIRRCVPPVIPGVCLTAGAAISWIAARPWRRARLVAAAATLLVVGLETRSVLVVRDRPYYADSLALVTMIADRLPADALVGMDSELAEIQLQVPLWLLTGRETIMRRQGGQRWRDVMQALPGSGRPLPGISGRDTPT